MINEKIRVSVTDLPARPSRPSDEEMEQIFGGWWFRRFAKRVGRTAQRLGQAGWKAAGTVGRSVRKAAKRIVSFFRGW